MSATTEEPLTEAAATPETIRKTSLWRDTLKGVLQQRSAVVGLAILAFLVAVALLADVIAPFPPDQVLLGIEENVMRRSPPCIYALGCPTDQPASRSSVRSSATSASRSA